MSTEQHENNFTFDFPGLQGVDFQMTNYEITSSQKSTWGGVSCSGNTVTVLAGRHKDTDVANDFNKAVKSGGAIALTYQDTAPDQLNFWITGTLTLHIGGIAYTSENFYLGQGSAKSGDNNWWIGSPQMSNITANNVDDAYARKVTELALHFAADIITDDPEGIVTDTVKAIVYAVGKHRVGSGEIPFTMSNSATSVELLLFQMADNHVTHGQLTGTYTHP